MASIEGKTGKSLYERLGGYDVIAGIIDDLLSRLMADPQFQRFGMGRSADSHNRARQLLVDQMAALAGGPVIYIGRDMKTSHAGLGITKKEWDINLKYTTAALDKFKIPAKEQAEFIALFERYKADIVEK
jgi:hemoglobin